MTTRGRLGFWFPLALLGFLTLGNAAFIQDGWRLDTTFFPSDTSTATLYGLEMSRAYEQRLLSVGSQVGPSGWLSTPNLEYWIFGTAFVFLAVIAWYAHGSGRVRPFALAAVCGVVAVVAFSCMMWIAERAPEAAPTVAGSLLAIGLCAAAWVYFQLGRGKSVLTAISVVTVAVGATGLLATWTSCRADQLLLVSVLAVLAWWERSLLVAALAAVLLVIGALSLSTVVQIVLVAGLLFVCAFVTLARRGGQVQAE
ncbi:hypothetical protein [Kibdelosporangium aridum]|uniref:Uncharacterized protein n=1 Tax=Kibdelosporangium aridum TaxID=2030 RepID=A0A1W2EAM8_KIBAR|nr:hypothetical protein [Kibdelosporangium aridum]SMD06108.1 hypothetical protein SAMN05661093_04048 [Kibdelosporangium aridum]